MERDKKRTVGSFDAWYNKLKEETKDIPDDDRFDEGLEKIIAQLERGDYTALGPELKKEIEEREKRKQEEKQKKIARPKEVSPR